MRSNSCTSAPTHDAQGAVPVQIGAFDKTLASIMGRVSPCKPFNRCAVDFVPQYPSFGLSARVGGYTPDSDSV